MKSLLITLLLAGVVLCEVPPPYPPRGFRPSPAFNLPIRQPQMTYGVPNASPSKISQSSPQRQYGVPNQPNTPNLTPNFNSKQTVPCVTNSVPATFSKSAAIRPSFNSKQTIPNTSYGVPVAVSPYRTILSESQIASQGLRQTNIPSLPPNFSPKQTIPSTSYGTPVTSSPYRTINDPQVIYGAPNQIRPSGQYDVPDVKNIETLEQIRQLNSLLQLSQSSNSNQQNQVDINLLQSQNSNRNVGIPSQQYLPVKEASNFKGNMQLPNSQRGNQQPALEYLPVKEPTNFRNGFDLSQSNVQESFNSQPNPNLQQPFQQYLPVREPLHVKKTLPQINVVTTPRNELSGQGVQPNVNIQQPANNPEVFNGPETFQTQIPQQNRNPNVGSLNPNLNNYNVPRQNSIEIERLNIRPLPNSNKVPISIHQNVARPIQNGKGNRDLEGSNIQGANRGQVDQRYLPPSTVRPVQTPTSTPAAFPKDSNGENEFPESQGEAGGPNLSVATAVSGIPSGQSFYLLQPDGRLQKVIYQKTRAEGNRENEYTANYLFQNIHADPGVVYSPLVSLGKR